MSAAMCREMYAVRRVMWAFCRVVFLLLLPQGRRDAQQRQQQTAVMLSTCRAGVLRVPAGPTHCPSQLPPLRSPPTSQLVSPLVERVSLALAATSIQAPCLVHIVGRTCRVRMQFPV